MANSTSFQIDIQANAGSVAPAADAVSRLASQLQASEDAATRAANAVSEGQAAFSRAEAAATAAAKAVEKVQIAMAGQAEAMRQALIAGDSGAAARAGAALQALTQRHIEAKAAALQTANALATEGSKLDALKGAAAAATKHVGDVAKAHDAAKKAAADAAGSGKINEMAEGFGKLGGPVGVLGQRVLGTAEGAKKLYATLGNKAILAGAAIGIAAIAAAIVTAGVAAVWGIAKIGLWAIQLADAQGKTKELSRLQEKFQKNVASIFGGLKIKGLTDGLEKLVDLFDANSSSGKALKVVFESIFQPMVDGLASLAPTAVRAFLTLEIWALRGLIAIKPYGSKIADVGKGMLAVGAAIAIGAAAATVALTALFVIANSGAAAFLNIWAAADRLRGFLSKMSLADIGMALVQGFANGITAGASAVLSAVTNLATGAIGAARKALDSRSPSRKLFSVGTDTADGMVGGVEAGTPKVQAAMETMVAPPELPASTTTNNVTTNNSQASTTPVQVTIIANGADDVVEKFLAALEGIGVSLGGAHA